MSTLQPSSVDYQAIVREASKTGQLSHLLKAVDQETQKSEVKKLPNAEQRMAEWQKSKDKIDLDKLQSASDTLTKYMERFYVDRVSMDEPRELEQSEVDRLAQEFLEGLQLMEDLSKARRDEIRTMVFTSIATSTRSMNEKLGVVTDTPPEQEKGRLVSEEYGVAFCKEGGDRTAPDLDWEKLQGLLSEEEFKLVCDTTLVPEQVIPEHVEYTPKGEKLMEALNTGVIDLEKIREAIKPGKWSSPRFTIRRI